MASLSEHKSTFSFVLAIVFVVILSYLSGGVRDRPAVVRIEGRIYERCVAGVPMDPVRGATIATTLDGATTTTDQNGGFRLVTSRPNVIDERHYLTARHGKMMLKTVAALRADKAIALAFSCIDSWKCALPGMEYVC
jgi:hypothetical protein